MIETVGDVMEFRLLGPVEVYAAGRVWEVGTPQQRLALSVLAIEADRPVSVEALIDRIWDEAPDGARRTLHVLLTRIRRLLEHVDRPETPVRLVRRSGGYALLVEPDRVDVHRFVRLVATARDPRCPAEERVGLLCDALRLQRGEPLAGLPGRWAVRTRESLRQQHIDVVVAWARAEMEVDNPDAVVAPLTELIGEHPLVESLTTVLMQALAATGRGADALDRYDRTRRLLAEELGTDPGPELQTTHRGILRGEPVASHTRDRSPDPLPRGAVRQLPAAPPHFTGRSAELALLTSLLDAQVETGGTVVLSAIDGFGGIGKSALAVHAGHRLADRFVDGQLYVDLHGATPGLTPLPPLEVLGRFLRALGVDPAAIPGEVDEAATRYRSTMAGRRMLVVLDNAVDAAQARPLLPAAAGCAVLVTSRRILTSLDGATHLHLDVLSEAEAIMLLGRLAGADRVAADPEAAAAVARLCGGLPLALRIAAARLAARPGWSVSALAHRLADARTRLDELDLGDLGVRSSCAVSHRELADSLDPTDKTAAAAFPLLGLPDGPDLGLPAAARLLDLPEPKTETVLERLVDAQLLETPTPGRYRLHDLLRLYARDLADAQLHRQAQLEALGRVFQYYTATTWRTLALLRPGDHRLVRASQRWATGGLNFADTTGAIEWLEPERANLTSVVTQATTTDELRDAAPQLVHALYGFLYMRDYVNDLIQVNQAALATVLHTTDRTAWAQICNDLGAAHLWYGRHEEAQASLANATAVYRQLDDRRGLAASLANLGDINVRQGHLDQALAYLRESLTLQRELGDRRGQAYSLNSLGNAYGRIGDPQAIQCFRESLAIHQELGDRYSHAIASHDLGTLHARQGRDSAALECLNECLATYREHGDRSSEAEALKDLGVAHAQSDRIEEALACLYDGLTIFHELDNPEGEADTLREIGKSIRRLGRHEQAQEYWRQALAIFEQLNPNRAEEVRTLLANSLDAGG